MKKSVFFAIMLLSAFQALAADAIGTYTVTAEALNIRDAPNGKVIGKLTREQVVSVYKTQESWSRISSDSEPSKWVSTASLRKADSTSPVPSTTTRPSYAAPSATKKSSAAPYSGGGCSCSSGGVCYGPRGGAYCYTSGGNKRYIGR